MMLGWNRVYIIQYDIRYTIKYSRNKGFSYKNLQILRFSIYWPIFVHLILVEDMQKNAKEQQNIRKVKVYVLQADSSPNVNKNRQVV